MDPDLVVDNLFERTTFVQQSVKLDDVRVLMLSRVSMRAVGEGLPAPDRFVQLIGGSVKTEDNDPGLGGLRVGGHRGRVQV